MTTSTLEHHAADERPSGGALAALSLVRARKDWRSKLAEAESGEGS